MTEKGPTLYRSTRLEDRRGRPRARWLNKPRTGGWNGVVFSEWELTSAEWNDRHAHDEFNYVIEGELTVECGGVTVVARTGDLVRVADGNLGRYSAPRYARMLAIYAPNPTGEVPTDTAFVELRGD